MPETFFTVRWPDGTVQQCYSPSLVVHDHLEAGCGYDLDDFVARASTALEVASERVRERYGFACSSALEQSAAIVRAAAAFPPGSRVEVLAALPVRP